MSGVVEYERQMASVMRALDEMFSGKYGGTELSTGIVLLVYPAGDPEGCNYMSSGTNRTEVIAALRSVIAVLEDDVEP